MNPVVMLVDDDASIVSAMRRALRNEGYELCFAASGTEALEKLEQQQVDVIVSDYRMPGMTGDGATDRGAAALCGHGAHHADRRSRSAGGDSGDQ